MKVFNYIFFIVTIAVYFTLSVITVKQIPIFADGTQHAWIVEYVYNHGFVPLTDITGTQPAYFNVPVSIKTNSPFLYQPFYYLIAGYLTFITRSPEASINLINFMSGLLSAILIYKISKKFFLGRQISYIAFVLILFSNIWFWMYFHRLVEPFIVFLSISSVWLLFLINDKNNFWNRCWFCLNLAIMFSTKLSTIPLIAALMITFVMTNKIKHSLQVAMISLLLIIPVIVFAYRVTEAPLVISTGIHRIDQLFPNAWWNQKEKDWEVDLNKEVDIKKMGNIIYNQYLEIHNSPKKIFQDYGIFGVINEFSILPLINRNLESFQSKVSGKLYLLNRLLFCLSIIFILRAIFWDKLFKNPYFLRFFILYTVSVSIIVFFWINQPEFRYYVYVVPFSIIFYLFPLEYIRRTSSGLTNILLIGTIVLITFYSTISEITGVKVYNFTAMYRQTPKQTGGLIDSIVFGDKIKKASDNSTTIFSPMKEIAYYSNKKFTWDYRLFFVKDIKKLEKYLAHYDFKYVVLPFYSGTNLASNWKYYNGIPSDSTFYDLLRDPKYFVQTEKNDTFTVYKRLR